MNKLRWLAGANILASIIAGGYWFYKYDVTAVPSEGIVGAVGIGFLFFVGVLTNWVNNRSSS